MKEQVAELVNESIKELGVFVDDAYIANEEGKKIFIEKCQWYAVYKVLSDIQDYPSKMTDFCDIMKNWGMHEVSPACDYESIRKIPNNVVFPTQNVTLWHNYKDKAEVKFKKQLIVAMKLMELLEK